MMHDRKEHELVPHKNLYDTLRVAPQAMDQEIDQAFGHMIKDFEESDSFFRETHDNFLREASHAYQLLHDPMLRHHYDSMLFDPQVSQDFAQINGWLDRQMNMLDHNVHHVIDQYRQNYSNSEGSHQGGNVYASQQCFSYSQKNDEQPEVHQVRRELKDNVIREEYRDNDEVNRYLTHLDAVAKGQGDNKKALEN